MSAQQDQGESGRSARHLRQQVRQGLLPPGGAGRRDRAAGRRGRALRVLRGLRQEEHQRGPDVPDSVHHGQAARRDESRPPLQGVPAVLRRPAPEVLQEQEVQGRQRVRDRGAARAQTQRAQRPDVHQREGGGRRPGQRERLQHLLTDVCARD